jgi:peptide/nickel transport system ATP-binding protein
VTAQPVPCAVRPERTSLIELEHITKYYRKGNVAALLDVSLRIEEGMIHALIGESGSGKTTLASVLLGVERQTGGTVRYRGENIASFDHERQKSYHRAVQAVFQNPLEALNPIFTIKKIIEEPLRTVPDKHERQRKVYEVLDEVMLPRSVLGQRTRDLSGGQRQRVAIARALVTKPSVVICDEAVSALDVIIQSQILELVKKLQRETGITFLFITHDLGVAAFIADSITVMQKGRIVESGAACDIFTKPRHEYTRRLLAAAQRR